MPRNNKVYLKARQKLTLMLVYPFEVEERLSKTCFRGKTNPLAGNFSQWDSFWEMVDTRWLRLEIAEMCRAIFEDPARMSTERFEIVSDEVVGWASTIKRQSLNGQKLTEFSPNKKSWALKVRDKNCPAPRTDVITFAAQFKRQRSRGVVIIRTIYPGPDIGQLNGDLREGHFAFLDWTNPGDTDNHWPVETV